MRPALLSCLVLGAAACPDPFPCTRYCWSHVQEVPDLAGVGMMGAPDGRFDGTCVTSAGNPAWHPPLPQLGWYSAETCVAADVHQVIVQTVASIEDPTIDATAACDVTDLEIYAELVAGLAAQARDACIDHLTCKGSPAGCDIDPTTAANEACTVPSATSLCNAVVLTPALAALSDLSNTPGAAQPQRDGTITVYLDDPQDCAGLLQDDTDGTPVCPGPAGGEGLDASSTDTGLDDTGSTDAGPSPTSSSG